MPAGYDKDSPAMQYANNWRKVHAEAVAEVKRAVESSWQWRWRSEDLAARMAQCNITIDTLIPGGSA